MDGNAVPRRVDGARRSRQQRQPGSWCRRRLRLDSNLGFEGELGYLFDVAGDTDALDWSVTNVSANAIYHFDVRRFTPYATFGLGFEHSGLDIKDPDILALYPPSSTEITYNFGGGVKYPITPRLLVRGDIRRFNANDLAPDYWRAYGGVTFRVGP